MGNMTDFNRDMLGFISRCAREYGDVVLTRFLYVPALFLFHPEHVDYILATHSRNFIKAQSLRSPFFFRLVGNGLLTSEGSFWRRQRRLAQPAFHRDRINAYGETMVDYAERMMQSWKDGETRAIHEEMTRLTQDIVVRTLFNTDVSEQYAEIGEALRIIAEPFASQATLRWILDNRLPTPGHFRFNRAVARLDRTIYQIINERRASDEDRGDLLSMLIGTQDEDGSRMTDRQLRDEVTTLFLAGYETTALALMWAWYLLALNPECETRLHEELEEVLDGRRPTVADLPRLRYAESVVKEAMRLYPPAYAVGREAIEDCEIAGYHVPKGMQIYSFQWVIHRDRRWYEAPDEFRPERWGSEETSKLLKYAYFPFGAGPRQCIGNTFAMIEAVLILATVAQRFRLKLAPGREVGLLPALSLRPKNGIWAVLEERRGQAALPD
jgi:cytochrome P450